jgi:uncharacterized protein YbcC (UPF0753/DUF2309 family)
VYHADTQPDPIAQLGDLRTSLRTAVEHASHVLPAQGPIGVFIHHNTLHAFQSIPFEEAVVRAAEVYGAEPFLSESRYRRELGRGRIAPGDLDAEVERELRTRGGDRELFGGRLTRAQMWRTVLAAGIDDDAGSSLRWRIEELGILRRFVDGVPASAARESIAKTSAWLRPMIDQGDLREIADVLVGERDLGRANERMVSQLSLKLSLGSVNAALLRTPEALAVVALWTACRRRVSEVPEAPPPPSPPALRRRDLLLRATGEDTDTLVNATMIRWTAAFLDQGVAYWPMPDRELGMLEAVRRLGPVAEWLTAEWLRPLRALLHDHERRELSAEDVVLEMLELLGVPPRDWQPYVERVLLALPGWAGLVRRLEREPELAPHRAPPCSLLDFLAVRLVHEYLAVRWVAREHLGFTGALVDLPRRLADAEPPDATARDRAYRLFQVCQLCGIAAPELLALTADEIAEGLAEMDAFSQLERRRLWHLAYERRHRQDVLTAIVQHRAAIDPARRPLTPRLQFVLCIDEREESMRRAIEELGAAYETFGTAGFFGFAMYYWGADDAHAAALCPVVVRPEHRVLEVAVDTDESVARGRLVRRRLWSKLARYAFVSSRSLVRGWIATVGLGLFSLAPLFVRVIAPRFTASLRARLRDAWFPRPRTRLMLMRDAEAQGELSTTLGISVDEQVGRVARVLEDAGFTAGFAPLVVVLGHGSTSLNNPHESAHDCGACGGRRGGPNARLFAQVANRPDVRAGLRRRGIDVPDTSWFVGGYHDTCNDSVVLYDLEAVPLSAQAHLLEARGVLDRAREMNAHERCRRFEAISPTARLELTLRHVEARAEHLAEPRPEYGHCTNAVCVFGRRGLTRGLFLDRRAFLVSYDPTRDEDGEVLARLLAAMAPVGAGINLEYYFSYVDNERYGCGTKLPHNVTGLVGVMNGHASDLRTGLPWQMVEIHEPVRMLTIVESTPAMLMAIAERVPGVGELIRNGWIQTVAIDPTDGTVSVFSDGAFVPFTPERVSLPEVQASAHWYTGHADHLPIAAVRAAMLDPPTSERPT